MGLNANPHLRKTNVSGSFYYVISIRSYYFGSIYRYCIREKRKRKSISSVCILFYISRIFFNINVVFKMTANVLRLCAAA